MKQFIFCVCACYHKREGILVFDRYIKVVHGSESSYNVRVYMCDLYLLHQKSCEVYTHLLSNATNLQSSWIMFDLFVIIATKRKLCFDVSGRSTAVMHTGSSVQKVYMSESCQYLFCFRVCVCIHYMCLNCMFIKFGHTSD